MNSDDPFEPQVADILGRARSDGDLTVAPTRDLVAGAHRRQRQRRAAQWGGAAVAVAVLCVGVAAAASALPPFQQHQVTNPIPTVGPTAGPVPIATPAPTSSGIAIGVASPTVASPSAPAASATPSTLPSAQETPTVSKSVTTTPSETPTAEPTPTRPTASTTLPPICASPLVDGVVQTAPVGETPTVTPLTAAQNTNLRAMGRQLCGYAAQLHVRVVELYEFMWAADQTCTEPAYEVQLSYTKDNASQGVWISLCPSPSGARGETPTLTIDQKDHAVDAAWPDGTDLAVQGVGWPSDSSAQSDDGWTLLKMIAADPVFDPPFAAGAPGLPPASGSAPPSASSSPASASASPSVPGPASPPASSPGSLAA